MIGLDLGDGVRPGREQALEGMEAALADKGSRDSREDLLAQMVSEAERMVGQLALENVLQGGGRQGGSQRGTEVATRRSGLQQTWAVIR